MGNIVLKIDWASWAAMLAVLGIILEVIRRFAKMYFVSREEFEKLEEIVGKLSFSIHDNARKVKGLYDERKSFREEVLDRIDSLAIRIDDWVAK